MNEKSVHKVITIDGPAGSGKSTVSRLLAERLGVLYLDTGAMYRAVALHAKREKISVQDKEKLKDLCRRLDLRFVKEESESRLFSGGEDISTAIRSPEMDMLSSEISAQKEVREAMTELQRRIGRDEELVAEGRDMGTVVFPDADFKFFVTAPPEVRALRRHKERSARGEEVSLKDVENEMAKRDDQDTNRAIAPLKAAEDAVIIDTGGLDAEQVVEVMLNVISPKSPEVRSIGR